MIYRVYASALRLAVPSALVFMCVNLIVGVEATRLDFRQMKTSKVEIASSGAQLDWPVDFTASASWTPPTRLVEQRMFGAHFIFADVSGSDGGVYRMKAVRLGWPLPVLEHLELSSHQRGESTPAASVFQQESFRILWMNLCVPSLLEGILFGWILAVVRAHSLRYRAADAEPFAESTETPASAPN